MVLEEVTTGVVVVVEVLTETSVVVVGSGDSLIGLQTVVVQLMVSQ